MKNKHFIIISIISVLSLYSVKLSAGGIDVIPRPMDLREGSGVFILKPSTSIQIDAGNKPLLEMAKLLVQKVALAGGPTLTVLTNEGKPKKKDVIILTLKDGDSLLGKEGYNLEISKKKVVMKSIAANGLFYGMQTLLQLFPPDIESTSGKDKVYSIPVLTIRDMPRYGYRGMHLDVGRHMFPVSFIKKYIDLMSTYKMNRFHWHLTEDQGWRIEIKKYPRLTQVGSTRTGSTKGRSGETDGIPYGGFYTQDQIREVVDYAASKFVTVIPEIEMPGHSVAALAAYPALSCTGGPFSVRTQWGVSDDIYCAGNDSTFLFIQDILNEVINLFPSEYIHIGGDEAPKVRWKACPKCQAKIQTEGLKDEMELQSYFIKRIEKFLSSKKRKIIGWDEILEGGLAPEATVMSWRGMQGGIDAATQGHDVIMTPTDYCYFDYYQADPATEPLAIGGYLPLKTVYSFDPTPPVLDPAKSHHILGAQGNLWTEYLKTPDLVEYMAYPRAIALAEVTWSQKELRNWESFQKRLESHYKRLDLKGVNYSKGSLQVDITTVRDSVNHRNLVKLSSESRDYEIVYTLDGSEPTPSSPKYLGPFGLKETAVIKASLVKDGEVKGKSNERKILSHIASGKPVKVMIPFSFKYPGTGKNAMTDGLTGSPSLKSGWQGYENSDMEIIIDLLKIEPIHKISATFLQEPGSWIIYPVEVEYLTSNDQSNWQSVGKIHTEPLPSRGKADREFSVDFPKTDVRYIKVKARNIKLLPDWHEYKGHPCWIFVDEIIVE